MRTHARAGRGSSDGGDRVELLRVASACGALLVVAAAVVADAASTLLLVAGGALAALTAGLLWWNARTLYDDAHAAIMLTVSSLGTSAVRVNSLDGDSDTVLFVGSLVFGFAGFAMLVMATFAGVRDKPTAPSADELHDLVYGHHDVDDDI